LRAASAGTCSQAVRQQPIAARRSGLQMHHWFVRPIPAGE